MIQSTPEREQHFLKIDQKVVKIQAKCFALSEYIRKYKKFFELLRDHIILFREYFSFFGLKKEICIEFLMHEKIHKQKRIHPTIRLLIQYR